MNTKFKEKRKTERINCRVPVLCKKDTIFDNTQTADISDAGVGFFSPRFIPINTKMIMQIALSAKASPLLAVGKVKWVHKIGYMDRYRVGMEFTDISDPAKDKLGDYIDENYKEGGV